MNPHDASIKRKIEKNLEELGPSPSVLRFLNKYGKDNTKRIYAISLVEYLRWLRQKGVNLNPDDLVRDNLRCVYESSATDVQTKRRHTDWLDDYVNRHMMEAGRAHNTRIVTAAAIQQFYKRNDSPLFGDFDVSRDSPTEAPRPLDPAEVRKVLIGLPVEARTPLLCVWQSGIEVNRMLGLTWGKLEGIETGSFLLRLDFRGRKKHGKSYYTFLGRNAIDYLRMWRGVWGEVMGRAPNPGDPVFLGKRGRYISATWLNYRFRNEALRMKRQGLISNGDPRSWHSHALRHCFRTEAAHAGVKPEISEFLLGHLGGIAYVYNHSDQLHPEDLVKEYLKIEPFVSLDFTETTARQEYEGTNKQMLQIIMELQKKVSRLEARSEPLGAQAPAGSRAAPTSGP
jgi:integrase